MAKNYNYPIIIGKNLKTGIVAGPNERGGADLYIVLLNKELESGSTFEKDDVEKVKALLHFCDRESLKRTIDVLTTVLLRWREDR